MATTKPKQDKGLSKAPEAVQKRFEQRKGWFLAEASRQGFNRAMMAKAEQFYDGIQWQHDEAEEVRSRGQNPIVYNQVKPVIDWLIGTERKARVDFVVVAQEDSDEASDDAITKTKLLKYLDECNRASFERSYAVDDCFKAGLGWLEVGLSGNEARSPIYVGAESWRNILYDSQGGVRRDLSDRRYIFRIKILDEDVAIALFPDKEEAIKRAVQIGDDQNIFREWLSGSGLLNGMETFNQAPNTDMDFMTPRPVDLFNPRRRVLLIECWNREPQTQYHPVSGIAAGVTFKMCCSVMTERETLIECWSPFKHDLFPFIPLWAYINKRTGLPYGPILPLIGPQEALNQRMSRSLYEGAANQIWLEEDAYNAEVMDIDELRAEIDDPAGTAVFAKNALAGNKVRDRVNQQRAQFMLELAEHDANSIREMSGVNNDNLGRNSNVQSGKAVMAKQEQGSLLTMELFDNLLFARQIEGELTLSLAEQFITQPMTLRVGGDNHKYEYHKINEQQPDGTYKNDITARKAHFVIGEQAWKATYAEAAFQSLMEILTQLASTTPEVVINLLDIVFQMHPNLPNKKAIMDRIRQVNGQVDPDGKPSPEQIQAAQEKKQIAAMEFEAKMKQLQADIREANARGEKLEAEAVAKRLEGIYEAAQAAQVLATAPGITPIADELLATVGFKDAAAQPEPVIDPTQQPPAPVQPMPPLQQADGAMQGIEGGPGAVDPALMPQLPPQ